VSRREGGDLYIVAAGGGEPRLVAMGEHLELGGSPVWTPDGERVMFLASDLRRGRLWDWWLVPKEGGTPVSTGLAELLVRRELPPLDIHSVPADWAKGGAVVSLRRGQVANLWLIPWDGAARRFSGEPRQITFGTARESMPRLARDGALVFVSESQNSHLYSIPWLLRGPAEPVRLTNDLALDPGFFRAVTRFSAGERYLLFPSGRQGNLDVFVKDLTTGEETGMTATPGPEDQPLLAPDGSQVIYRSPESGANALYLARIGTQVSRKVCEDCGEPSSWTSDGRRVLFIGRTGLGILNLETGAKTEIYRRNGAILRHADLSPDQRFLALTLDDPSSRGERAFLVDFSGERPAPEDRWVEILQGTGVESLHWAPDGSAVYYFARVDDFRCLWRLPVGHDGRPSGAPATVAHFHGVPSAWSSWVTVTRERVVFSLTEPVASVWTARLTPSR
jgi:Tol biopolymer transport system component